jgi:hypothetical protein
LGIGLGLGLGLALGAFAALRAGLDEGRAQVVVQLVLDRACRDLLCAGIRSAEGTQ